MSDVFSRINEDIDALKIGAYAGGLMSLLDSEAMSPAQLDAVALVFDHLRRQKEETIRNTLLKMSRLPLKEPKTFSNFDFNNVRGKQVESLKNLPALTAVNAGRNLAFIGPQGVGKTHLAMAYGRECCIRGMKTYFLKATELNQRLTDAVKYGRESSTINGLVKPSCLIIDEIGYTPITRSQANRFFTFISDTYETSSIIFTTNKEIMNWAELMGDPVLTTAMLDRILHHANCYSFRGESYRLKHPDVFS